MTNKVRWLVLPTKANKEMEEAGAAAAREYLAQTGGNSLFKIYEAMVLAAPQPPHIEDDEISEFLRLLPWPIDDDEYPIDGEDIYNDRDMGQQWNSCLEACRPVVMRLQAERAEWDALLREALPMLDLAATAFKSANPVRAKIRAALSASAEPSAPASFIACHVDESCGQSAPVERDERSDFERYALAKGWLPQHLAEKTENGNYKDWGVNPEWQAWKARAALEREEFHG